MMMTADLPETVALALMTNNPDHWLTAVTDLGILSQEPPDDPNMLPFTENAPPECAYLAQGYMQNAWGCSTSPEPSPTPSFSAQSTVFDFSPAPSTSEQSELSPAGPGSPSPSLCSEATVDLQFAVKEELRNKIQQKRRKSGLGDLTVDIKPEIKEVLTPADENRRERRRASNRRAALKCRQKKKEEQEKIMQEYLKTKDEMSRLRLELQQLQSEFSAHLKRCKSPR